MPCACEQLPELFFIDEAPQRWRDSLVQEDGRRWKMLRRCPSCDRHYSIDVFDKFQDQVVVRVLNLACWEEEADSINPRKNLLLRSRGGTTSESCMWAGCSRSRVRGVAYCIDHLWDAGTRR